jgi:hypothetical protein
MNCLLQNFLAAYYINESLLNTLPVTVATLDTVVSYIGFTQHAMIDTFRVRETSLTIVPC